MRIARFLFATIIAILPLLVTAAPQAEACSCAPTTAAEKAEYAELVVVGTVFMGRNLSGGQVSVDQYLKGSGPKFISVNSYAGGMCGTTLENGATYLMYIFDERTGHPELGHSVNMCSAPRKITPSTRAAVGREIKEVREALAQQPEPTATSPPTAPADATPTSAATALPAGGTGDGDRGGSAAPWLLAVAGAAAVVAFGGAVLAWRVRRPLSP
jgi:hypothetical protein